MIIGCVACAVAACSTMSWKSPLGRDHSLTGRIWDVSSARFIDRETLVERLAGADFVLLGERHDNPDHHMQQAGSQGIQRSKDAVSNACIIFSPQ